MKTYPLVALLCVTALSLPIDAQIKPPTNVKPPVTEKRQEELLQWYVKFVANPKASYTAKSGARDMVANHLSLFRLNEASKAGFLQTNPEFGQEAFNGLFWEGTPAAYIDGNLKFVAEHITQVPTQVQLGVLSDLSAGIGVQTPAREALYHATAKSVAQKQLSKSALDSWGNDALSRACLSLALSPLYDADDEKLLLKSVGLTKSVGPLAQALSYRKLLTQPLFDQLYKHSPSDYYNKLVMEVVAAEINPKAQQLLVEKIKGISGKKYQTADDPDGDAVNEDSPYLTALRFIHIPEKEALLLKASQSPNTIIRVAALFTATEDFPELVLNSNFVAAFKGNVMVSPDQYQETITYLALRHSAYIERAQKILGLKIFKENVKKVRDVQYLLDTGTKGFDGN